MNYKLFLVWFIAVRHFAPLVKNPISFSAKKIALHYDNDTSISSISGNGMIA